MNLLKTKLVEAEAKRAMSKVGWWSERFDIAGVCFWHSGIGNVAVGVYEDEYLEEQVKEINRRLGLL